MSPNETFDNYMSALPARERIAKSRDLRQLGGLSPSNLSDWRKGRCSISAAWQRKINEITGDNVFAITES